MDEFNKKEFTFTGRQLKYGAVALMIAGAFIARAFLDIRR